MMKAVGLYRYGGPEVLQVVDIPMPNLEKGDLLVRVVAAPVTPIDGAIRAGLRAELPARLERPVIPGLEFAGYVAAIGPDTNTRLVAGDPVVGLAAPLTARRGAHAAFLAVRASSVALAPAGLSMSSASTILLSALTARTAVDILGRVAGRTLLITGAAGLVGGHVLQLAHSRGARIVSVADTTDEPQLTRWGADVLIPRGSSLNARVLELFPKGVDFIIDTADIRLGVLPSLKPGGRFVTFHRWAPVADQNDVIYVDPAFPTQGSPLLVEALTDASRLRLDVRVSAVLPFTAAADANRLAASGGLRGRVVLDFSSAS